MVHIDRRQVIQGVMSSALPAVASGTAAGKWRQSVREGSHQPVPDENGSVEPTSTEDWQSIEPRSHLTVHYKQGYNGDAGQVAGYYTDAEDFGKDELPDSIPIEYETKIFVTPEDEWDESDGTLYWLGTFPREVHLQAPSDSPNDERWHRTGLGHELYNIVLRTYHENSDATYNYYRRNPSWFAEGFSEYLTERQPSTIDGYPDAGLQNMMDQISNGDGYFGNVSENRYHGGHLLCEYLLDTEGINYEVFFSIILNDAETWSQAVEAEFGMTHFEMSLGWLAWAEENIGGDFSTPLVTAADQLRTGEVTTEKLSGMIDVWRSGEPM